VPAVGGSLLAAEVSQPVEESGAPPAATGEPPRLLLGLSLAVVIVSTTMAVTGAWRTGVSWDEPFHVMRLRNFLDHGWFALDWSVASGGSSDAESNTLVYGPVAMLLLHGLTALVGVEGWGSVSTSPDAYAVRHLGVVAIGLAGTGAAACITRVLQGSWRWALVTAAVLLALPMWTGQLMFNIKDVPVATGYTLVTLALVAMVSPTRGRAMARVTALVAGAVLMLGTRPGMVTALLGGVLLLAAGAVLTQQRLRPMLVELAIALGSTAVVLVALYPGVYADPLSLIGSAEQSTRFRGGGGAGLLYIPFHLVAEFPLLLQGAAALGLAYAVRTGGRQRRMPSPQLVRICLVVAQAAALPLVAVATDADLYNGLRQLLFAAPAWAVIATLGIVQVVGWARRRGRPRLVGALVGALVALALVLPVLDQLTLFPYQYSYWNVALDTTGARVQSDYWRTSVPELLPDIPTNGQIICGPTRSSRLGAPAGTPEAAGVEESDMMAGRYSSDSSVDCRTDPLGPLSSRWSADDLPLGTALPHNEFYVVIDRDHAVPSNCDQLASVNRQRHWREVSMTYVARCQLDPSPLDDPVEFVRLPGENMAPPLWTYAPEGWVMRESEVAIDASGTAASLTFAAPASCGSCALALDADAPADLTATVNDAPAAVEVGGGSAYVDLGTDPGDTWVTFTRTSGAPLGLRVRSIRVVPHGTR